MNWFILSAIQFIFGFLGIVYIYISFENIEKAELLSVSFFSALLISNSLYFAMQGIRNLQEGKNNDNS